MGSDESTSQPEGRPADGARMTREEIAERLRPGATYGELPGRHVTVNQLVAYNMTFFRKAAGLTQEQLAQELLGWTGRPWSKAAVSAAERSWDGKKIRQFDADLIFGLSFALGVPVTAFFLPPDADGVRERFLVAAPYTYDDDVDEDVRNLMFHKARSLRMYDLMLYALSDPTTDREPAAQAYKARLLAALDFYFEVSAAPEYLDSVTSKEQLVRRLERSRQQQVVLRGILGDTEEVIEFLSDKLRALPSDELDAEGSAGEESG